jgi:hypothetical protein
MPPIIPNRAARQVQALARPANQARALAQQQQGGSSGTIPGTSSSAQQVAHTTGLIPTYPVPASPNGDQVSGVGLQVLNNAGNPVVVAGNLHATQTSAKDLPTNFSDGGFAFVDAAGNLVAGYSQDTGLWGFDPAAAGATEVIQTAWMDWVTSPAMQVNVGTSSRGLAVTVPGYGITVPTMIPPGAPTSGFMYNACVTQVGPYAGGSIGFWVNGANWIDEGPSAVVTAYTLDGTSSIELYSAGYFAAPDANNSCQVVGWNVTAVTGSAFSAPGVADSVFSGSAAELVVTDAVMMAVNYQICGVQGN